MYYIVWYYITLHYIVVYSITLHDIILQYSMLYCTILHYITLYFIRSVGNYGKHRSGEIYIKICYINIEQENLVPIMMSTCFMVTMVNKYWILMRFSLPIYMNCDSDFVFAFSHCKSATTERRVGKKPSLEWWLVRVSIPILGLSAVERNIVI